MAAQGFKANFLGTKKTNKKDWILFGYVSGSIQEVLRSSLEKS